ncbi:trypco2 family protein [Streptomyces sp. NPDC007369]|uniref:trypco2 family protein n=1 Tax=Streptomyces sp. NPDC007369 TaxID=3154589 RepID=UPI0033E798A9
MPDGPHRNGVRPELHAYATARIGVKAWVVSAEASGGVARTNTQRAVVRPRGAGRVEGYVEP